jgi:carbamoyltransferase
VIFYARDGCESFYTAKINTGFELVCTPEDAFRCFVGWEIELPVEGNCILRKEKQGPAP